MRASGAARLDASFGEHALALSELRLFPCPVFPFAPSLDVRRRIARERVPTSRNGVGRSNRQTRFFTEMQSIRPCSGSDRATPIFIFRKSIACPQPPPP